MMELVFLLLFLLSSWPTLITQSDTTTRDNDWNDVVMTTVGRPVTLFCVDWSLKGNVKINWMVKPPGLNQWKLVLTANERKEFLGTSKTSMRLADPNFQDSGNFSLLFVPTMEDAGRYSCLIERPERKLQQKIILLAMLRVTITPASPVPQQGILRLIAEVYPTFAVSAVTWKSPTDRPLRTETVGRLLVTKLPKVSTLDNGVYVCEVHPRGNSSTRTFRFPTEVTMDASNVYSFTDINHAAQISTACLSQTPFPLPCPPVLGDYVQVYWQPPDSKKADMDLLFQYDRWRGHSQQARPQLQLAGPPARPEEGDFSFLLTPTGVKDGGLYCCEVFLNDNVFSQRTLLSVLKVKASITPSSLVLSCQYSELSQVKKAGWTHHNLSHKLTSSAPYPGRLSTTIPLPATEDTAGNYTCTLQLQNGQTFRALYTVTAPPKDSNSVSSPSLPPSLSALLLLVPLVAAVAVVLLWRQGQITRRRGIEQSLSHYSGEVENIYENPEDIRQTSLQGSVYMDLKPREDDEVYKELDRNEQCLYTDLPT